MSHNKKSPGMSMVSMTELVLPNDTNVLSNLMGGRLMHWMDIASAIAAQKHAEQIVVTASVDNISFTAPIQLGSIVTLVAKVTRSFKTSMEVKIEVFTENIRSKKKFKSNSAYFTFVALDKDNNPVSVPGVEPETEEEKENYERAMQRRQIRLMLAKK